MKRIVLLGMITMYLVRHGQTEENLQRIFQGHLPGVLTEEGRKQAVDLGPQLENLSLDAVVSSDLQRVIDTVLLAFGSQACDSLDGDDLLWDDYGRTQLVDGQTQLVKNDRFLMHRGRKIPWETTQLLREIDWGSWTGLLVSSVDASRLPVDAESKEMLYERAGRFLDYLKKNYDGKTVLVVAHGLVNRSIQAQIEGVEVDRLYDVTHMKNAEVRKFVWYT